MHAFAHRQHAMPKARVRSAGIDDHARAATTSPDSPNTRTPIPTHGFHASAAGPSARPSTFSDSSPIAANVYVRTVPGGLRRPTRYKPSNATVTAADATRIVPDRR